MSLPTTLTDAIGTIGVLVRLLSEADDVLGTLDCEDTAEQDQMDQLRDAIMAATAPFLGRLDTLQLLNQLKPPQPEERRRPLVQVAVQALNSVKAWRDSDGNEGFPHDTRVLIEAVLTAWELRQREEAEQPPEAVAEVYQHPGWRTECVPLLVPLPGFKRLPIGTKLYAGSPPPDTAPLTPAQVQRGFMAAGTDSTNGPNNWVEGIRFAERFHGVSGPAIAVDETPDETEGKPFWKDGPSPLPSFNCAGDVRSPANHSLAAAFGAADAAEQKNLTGYYAMAARVLATEVRRRKVGHDALNELTLKTGQLIEHLQTSGRLQPCFNLPALDAARKVLRAELAYFVLDFEQRQGQPQGATSGVTPERGSKSAPSQAAPGDSA